MRSTNELIKELRNAPQQWIDTAIVVAFEDRFEFVAEGLEHRRSSAQLDKRAKLEKPRRLVNEPANRRTHPGSGARRHAGWQFFFFSIAS
jgi:hypothetical protein